MPLSTLWFEKTKHKAILVMTPVIIGGVLGSGLGKQPEASLGAKYKERDSGVFVAGSLDTGQGGWERRNTEFCGNSCAAYGTL